MRVKLLSETALPPTRATDGSAGYDLYYPGRCNGSETQVTLLPGCITLIDTELSIEIPPRYVGLVCPRSGLASKGVTVANSPGVIDSDFRGRLGVLLVNNSKTNYVVQPRTRIAQLVVVPCKTLDVEIVSELSDTIRGSGGFGSTGA